MPGSEPRAAASKSHLKKIKWMYLHTTRAIDITQLKATHLKNLPVKAWKYKRLEFQILFGRESSILRTSSWLSLCAREIYICPVYGFADCEHLKCWERITRVSSNTLLPNLNMIIKSYVCFLLLKVMKIGWEWIDILGRCVLLLQMQYVTFLL